MRGLIQILKVKNGVLRHFVNPLCETLHVIHQSNDLEGTILMMHKYWGQTGSNTVKIDSISYFDVNMHLQIAKIGQTTENICKNYYLNKKPK